MRIIYILPLWSENIFEVNGDAGLLWPVIGEPIEDWDASGDLGAEWCCPPCLGFNPFIFETWRGWPALLLPWPSFLLAPGNGGGGGGIADPGYPTGGWPGIFPCWAPIPSGVQKCLFRSIDVDWFLTLEWFSMCFKTIIDFDASIERFWTNFLLHPCHSWKQVKYDFYI